MSSSSSSSVVIGSEYRYIKLRRYGMTAYTEGRTQGYRMRVVAIEALNMPKEIFVYRQLPPVPLSGAVNSQFENVASPVDLVEYQAGEPAVDQTLFRLDNIDVLDRHIDLLSEGWEHILEDVTGLVSTLDAMDELELDEEVVVGTEPSVPGSSSSSSSSSSSESSSSSSSSSA